MHGMVFGFCQDFDENLKIVPSLFRTQQATIISSEKISTPTGSVAQQQEAVGRIMNHSLEVHNRVYDKYQHQKENQQATSAFNNFFTSSATKQAISKISLPPLVDHGESTENCSQDIYNSSPFILPTQDVKEEQTRVPFTMGESIKIQGKEKGVRKGSSGDPIEVVASQKRKKPEEPDKSEEPEAKKQKIDQIPDSILAIIDYSAYKSRLASRIELAKQQQ